MEFFRRLGFAFNPQFTNDAAACLVIAENIYTMLLTEKMFAGFAPCPVGDARKSTSVLVALSRESRAAVDNMVQRAVAAGATTYREPQDLGFMYSHCFQDLDGHVWEFFYMEPGTPN